MYDGLERSFCPHVIGWNFGAELVLVWQYAGSTSRGPILPPGQWKCLLIADMSQLTTTNEPWHAGMPGGTRMPTNCVTTVDRQVQF
jgi:hypothetical protein